MIVDENATKPICLAVIEILAKEAQVLRIAPPVTVCGDIYGQFYDLKQLFKVGSKVPSTKYLFLGDIVDCGHYSVETFLLLLALKIRYPERLYLIKGNHETRELTLKYGFYKECKEKYGSPSVWEHYTKVFDFISLGTVIANKVFCIHGGLSAHISTLDEINCIQKESLTTNSPGSDLVWFWLPVWT